MKYAETILVATVLRRLAMRLAITEEALFNAQTTEERSIWEARVTQIKECIQDIEYIAKK